MLLDRDWLLVGTRWTVDRCVSWRGERFVRSGNPSMRSGEPVDIVSRWVEVLGYRIKTIGEGLVFLSL